MVAEDEDDRDVCPECNGNGWVYDPSDGGTMCCPLCDGESDDLETEEV